MVSHIASPWNHAVSFLATVYKDQLISTASGFFWRFESRTFLVSNWHVLSGKDPATGQAIRKDGGLPDRMKFTAFKRETPSDAEGFYRMTPVLLEATLCAEYWTDCRWREHPTFGRRVDLGAIDVSAELAGGGVEVDYVNLLESDAMLDPFVSQDAFIVGYPLGLISSVPIPVWKRATIASEPMFDADGLPRFYVDTATREGMSGSVVLARHMPLGPYKKADGSVAEVVIARLDRILGIYSGRIGPHNVEAQLGIVWKRPLIDDVVSAGVTPTI